LDRWSWPDIGAARDAGVDAVVVAFGATEQHGPHLPVATDRLIGDELARRVADRLGAFVAPSVPFGCSEHHLAFPGTISLREETFAAVVRDVVDSLVATGFRRIVLLPSHGGNFGSLGRATANLEVPPGVRVDAVSDLSVLTSLPVLAFEEFGVPPERGGMHAGEWETSVVLATHPELVQQSKAEPGYVGDIDEALAVVFRDGVHTLAPNGVLGDPQGASSEHGERYLAKIVETILDQIGASDRK
jgi:creatinine amidohydrolase